MLWGELLTYPPGEPSCGGSSSNRFRIRRNIDEPQIIFPLAAPLVLLGMLFTLLGSGMPVRAASAMLPPGVWNIEVIDNAGNVGEFSSSSWMLTIIRMSAIMTAPTDS